ncbi:MAG TPA: alpha/beta hydrolase [Gemmatimonadaceae bacterium]|nr:alpha/beta hydrolase [Gemmatimonadaceae bacterium]
MSAVGAGIGGDLSLPIPDRTSDAVRGMTMPLGPCRRFLTTCLLTVVAACAPIASGAQAPATARDGFVVTADSTRLFFRVVGTAPDTVIAIHGGPGVDLESIYGDFLPLARRHTVIFYDQRGTGRSTLPQDTGTLNAMQQVSDLDAVRSHFKLARVTLVAHSYGPLLAATYAIAHPARVARMVFFGPVPPRRGDFWQRFATSMQVRMDSTERRALAAANRRLADTSASDSAVRTACTEYWAIAMRPRLADPVAGMKLIRSDLCASSARGIRYGLTRTNGAVMASYGDWDLRSALRTLKVPTLVVHGEAESIPMDLVEEWATSLPDATLIKVPRAAHFAYAERPDLVWPVVERFLSKR